MVVATRDLDLLRTKLDLDLAVTMEALFGWFLLLACLGLTGISW